MGVIVRCSSWGTCCNSFAFLPAILLLVLLPLTAYAQVSGATLSGTVTDSSGAIIANVQILIKNGGTGEIRSVTVDSAGLYTAPNLLPGQYEAPVSAPGFSTAVSNGGTLPPGALKQLNAKIKVAR